MRISRYLEKGTSSDVVLTCTSWDRAKYIGNNIAIKLMEDVYFDLMLVIITPKLKCIE